MKVLVIGAAGMIGRKLCERLLKDGHVGGGEIGDLTMADAVPSDLAGARSIMVDLAKPDAPAALKGTFVPTPTPKAKP